MISVFGFLLLAQLAGELGATSSGDSVSPEAPWGEEILVTASRIEQPVEEAPASVTVLDWEDIERSAAQTVDDLLRQVPGFSLFRRSSSLVAHPTSQGVSLRGIGPSGVSRSLVLLDGVPLNDPFGGWVAWSKVPLSSLERIEVVRGGGSSLWGNYALGGVIHLVSLPPAEKSLRFLGAAGSHGELSLDLAASDVLGRLGVGLAASSFETDGYHVVREDQRGVIDVPVSARHETFSTQLRLTLSPTAEMGLRGRVFQEDRGNGTPLTRNATDSASLAFEATIQTPDSGEWQLIVSGEDQNFGSTFSAQAQDRSSERPALDQFEVEARSLGASLQWSRPVGTSHRLVAGGDGLWVEGATHEDFRFLGGRFTRRRRAGGEQRLAGVYLQEIYAPSERWQVVLGGRWDRWESVRGRRVETSLETGEPLRDLALEDRTTTTFSPRLAILYRLDGRITWRGSLYRSFRAPTLNELYRPFRVRNDITEPNPELRSERLLGGEAGLSYRCGDLLAQVTGFWNEVEDPVANVTLAAGPGVIAPCGFVPGGGTCRQRRNLGRSRIRGLEAEVRFRPARRVWLEASYLWNDATILKAPGQGALEGRRLAQVPEHRLVLGLGYSHPAGLGAYLQGRYVGAQFDDDLGLRELGDFAVFDLKLDHPIRQGWEVFLAVENLFDQEFEVGRTAAGLVTTGAPRLLHGGFRWKLGPPAP